MTNSIRADASDISLTKNVLAIIQARMGSTRLPGKTLELIKGRPMLCHVVERTQRSKLLNEICVATTSLPADDAIVSLCLENGWKYYRGSEEDVLSRYYEAAIHMGCEKDDVVVRITSDCPLIDPEVIDLVIDQLLTDVADFDYASNSMEPRTFPRGLDVEAFYFRALEKAYKMDQNPKWREHVTPYIYRSPEKFSLKSVQNDQDFSHLRLTVDTPEDLDLIRRIFDFFPNKYFLLDDILRVMEEHPEWQKINMHIEQKKVT